MRAGEWYRSAATTTTHYVYANRRTACGWVSSLASGWAPAPDWSRRCARCQQSLDRPVPERQTPWIPQQRQPQPAPAAAPLVYAGTDPTVAMIYAYQRQVG